MSAPRTHAPTTIVCCARDLAASGGGGSDERLARPRNAGSSSPGGAPGRARRRALPVQVGALSGLGLLLALSGCLVGPKFAKPQVTVNEGWRQNSDPKVATADEVTVEWWKAFDDPVLDRLVELAYQQNLSLQVAGLKIMEARALLGVATGSQWPQQQVLAGHATAVGLSKNTPTAQFVERNYGDYQVGFDATWELDFWGKYRRGVEAQAASLLASMADYQSALVSLTAEVARTYVAMRTFEVLIVLAQENATIQEEGLRIAESRFRNGAASELDPSQATTLLESTRASIPQLQASLQQARNALSTLVGQPAGAIDTLLVGPHEIPKAPEKVGVSVPAEMLRRRPDIRSAELVAAAQCARVGVAKADLYPSFSLAGTIGFQVSGGSAGKLLSGNSFFYTFGPQISWPFFNYGRIENNVRVEDARFQQLLVGYRDTVLRAAQEVEDALTGFLNARVALVSQQRSVTAAQRSVEIAVIQYREGATDYERVLDAQRSLLVQQNSLAQTSSSVTTNVIALYKALGGGWELRQGLPYLPEPMKDEMRKRTNWGQVLSESTGPEASQSPQPVKR